MFEIIGILTVWLFGGVAAFYLPILTCGIWAKTGDGLSDLAAGLWIGGVLLAVYLASTIIYFIAT